MTAHTRSWPSVPRKTAGISPGRPISDPVRENQQRGAVECLELLDTVFDYAPKKEARS